MAVRDNDSESDTIPFQNTFLIQIPLLAQGRSPGLRFHMRYCDKGDVEAAEGGARLCSGDEEVPLRLGGRRCQVERDNSGSGRRFVNRR